MLKDNKPRIAACGFSLKTLKIYNPLFARGINIENFQFEGFLAITVWEQKGISKSVHSKFACDYEITF